MKHIWLIVHDIYTTYSMHNNIIFKNLIELMIMIEKMMIRMATTVMM